MGQSLSEFLTWLKAKHIGWELPVLFINVKIRSGCRTFDLCQAKSADLREGTLTLTADITKNRAARIIPLNSDVVNDLKRFAGPIWLWEASLEDSKKYRPCPQTLSKTHFDPSTWRWTIQNIFREFNRNRSPDARLRPHDLRARTITRLAEETQSIEATAHAMGINAQTARHYVDAEKAFKGSDVLRQLADKLFPE